MKEKMKRVVIFGASDFGIKLVQRLSDKYELVGFVDNNKLKISSKLYGLNIMDPTQLKQIDYDEIIIGNNSFESIDIIITQLLLMGINKEKINTKYTYREEWTTTRQVFKEQHNLFDGYSKEGFLRFNIIVIYLGIENIYKKNDFGLELCKKYRSIVMPEDSIEKYIENFKKLVIEFEKDKYNSNHPIAVNYNGNLIDGSHRMALLIYHGIDKVLKRIIDTSWNLQEPRDINWFYRYQEIFSKQEIDSIISKYEEVKQKVDQIAR